MLTENSVQIPLSLTLSPYACSLAGPAEMLSLRILATEPMEREAQ